MISAVLIVPTRDLEMRYAFHLDRTKVWVSATSESVVTIYNRFAAICLKSSPYKRKIRTAKAVRIFLAEDEGFEPPQTESESGVLPLH